MRLSDIKGERTLDVIADLIDPVCEIAEDPNAAGLFKREKLPEGVTAKKYMMDRVRKYAPGLMKNHRAALLTILSTIEGVTADEYAAGLNLGKLIQDVFELITDNAIGDLFTSAQSADTTSGSVQENTAAPAV